MKFFPSLKLKRVHLLTSLRIVSVVVAMMITGAIVGVSFFLYAYLYRTIAQSEEIILLKQEVAPESIDIEQVRKTIDNLEEKDARPALPERYRNPFSFGEIIPPPTEPAPTTTQQ